jgi:hypothetical protein
MIASTPKTCLASSSQIFAKTESFPETVTIKRRILFAGRLVHPSA